MSEIECPICYDTVELCDTKTTPCKHIFCNSCYEKLNDCALCRCSIQKRPVWHLISVSVEIFDKSIMHPNKKRLCNINMRCLCRLEGICQIAHHVQQTLNCMIEFNDMYKSQFDSYKKQIRKNILSSKKVRDYLMQSIFLKYENHLLKGQVEHSVEIQKSQITEKRVRAQHQKATMGFARSRNGLHIGGQGQRKR